MLYCPKCRFMFSKPKDKGKIIDSEFVFDKKLMCYTVRRRRQCSACNTKWTTVELNKKEVIKLENKN